VPLLTSFYLGPLVAVVANFVYSLTVDTPLGEVLRSKFDDYGAERELGFQTSIVARLRLRRDGAAAARGFSVPLAPQGLDGCARLVGVFFGGSADTSVWRAIVMFCTRSPWTSSLTLPGEDLRLVRLRLGIFASLRTSLRDLWACSSAASRTL
jgi:hypothetical protein